jgi:hypothetical protein
MVFNGITTIQNFVKIVQVVLKLKGLDTYTYTHSHTHSLETIRFRQDKKKQAKNYLTGLLVMEMLYNYFLDFPEMQPPLLRPALRNTASWVVTNICQGTPALALFLLRNILHPPMYLIGISAALPRVFPLSLICDSSQHWNMPRPLPYITNTDAMGRHETASRPASRYTCTCNVGEAPRHLTEEQAKFGSKSLQENSSAIVRAFIRAGLKFSALKRQPIELKDVPGMKTYGSHF